MLGIGALGQFPLGGGPFGTATIVTISWYAPLSEPVRFKQLPRAAVAVNNQTFAFNPQPFVSFGYFSALSEPVRQRPRNPAALSPYAFMQPAPSPFVATGWFSWLSEPVRIKPGLRAYLQKTDTQDPRFIPAPSTLVEGWYNWLSEPKRFPKGLGSHLQPSYTAPGRMPLPKPNVTVTINAVEIDNDVVSIAVNVVKSNPAVSAKVSIIEIGSGNSATAVIEH